ncbi:MAG: hypothetical protein AAGJ34_12865 [Pseudomonadota bacterium]
MSCDRIPSIDVDPCGRYEKLNEIRDRLITQKGVSEYELEQGNGVKRRVRYTAADLGRLDRQIADAERACVSRRGGVAKSRSFYPQTSKGLS